MMAVRYFRSLQTSNVNGHQYFCTDRVRHIGAARPLRRLPVQSKVPPLDPIILLNLIFHPSTLTAAQGFCKKDRRSTV